jgi:hypothetical protein
MFEKAEGQSGFLSLNAKRTAPGGAIRFVARCVQLCKTTRKNQRFGRGCHSGCNFVETRGRISSTFNCCHFDFHSHPQTMAWWFKFYHRIKYFLIDKILIERSIFY